MDEVVLVYAILPGVEARALRTLAVWFVGGCVGIAVGTCVGIVGSDDGMVVGANELFDQAQA